MLDQTYQPPVETTTARASRTRFIVLAFLCTLALLLYIDRVCIGQAEQSIREELNLTKWQMTFVFNAFTLAYCLFEVPTGHLGDRYGSRSIIARVVVWWSVFTALTGACFGIWTLVGVRFLFGAGEAGAFPNVARVITRWFPLEERGRIRGSITTISLFGGALAPILSATLIHHVGWRATFAIFGAVGIIWAVIFYYWFRDNPAEHSQVNAAELQLIRYRQEHEDQKTAHSIPWGHVLISPTMWLLGLIMTASAVLFYMQFQWYPTYLKEARGQGEQWSGWMTSAVMTGGACGAIMGGFLVDFVNRRTTERRWTRSLCGSIPAALGACCVYAMRYDDSAAWATGCNALALFFLQLTIPTWWTVVAEISGRHGAAMWGLMNSLGGLGLMATMFFVGSYLDTQESRGVPPLAAWQPVFDGVALVLAGGALCWLLIDARKSIVGDDR